MHQMNQSEKLFYDYLIRQQIKSSPHFSVNSNNDKNVDFRLTEGKQVILCDVKEVRDSEVQLGIENKLRGGRITAQDHIRGDIKKLRKKFTNLPTVPVLLVSMNFSSDDFTALTVARALMGEIGVFFERGSKDNVSNVHHLHDGNASLRKEMHTTISGVLLFDIANGNHCLFRNPFANHEIPLDFFSGIKILNLRKDESQEDIIVLGDIIFTGKDES